jgi:hypothetical protein
MNTPAVLRGLVRWMLAGAALAALSGCISVPKGEGFYQLEGEAGKSVLYIYRDHGVVGYGLELQVILNDAPLVTLPAGTFHVQLVKPGRHSFKTRARRGKEPVLSGVQPSQLEGNTLLQLEMKEANTYYVVVEEGLGYVLLESVPAVVALDKLRYLRVAPSP